MCSVLPYVVILQYFILTNFKDNAEGKGQQKVTVLVHPDYCLLGDPAGKVSLVWCFSVQCEKGYRLATEEPITKKYPTGQSSNTLPKIEIYGNLES